MKKYFSLLIVFCLAIATAYAQQPEGSPPVTDQKHETPLVFDIVEEPAKHEGDLKGFYEFVSRNLKYPTKAIEAGIEGNVYVRFIIDEEGRVISAEVVPGREKGWGMDEEAIRVVKLTKWTPARQRGKTVQQRKIMPVKFKLPAKD